MKRLLLLILTTLMIVLFFGCNAEETMPVDKDTKVADEKTVDIENEEEKNTTDEEAVNSENEENPDITDDEAVNVENEEKADTADETETEVELVTREWIIEHFGFSEEELEGIDVDAVIQYRKYTQELLEHKIYTKEYLLDSLKFYDEKMKTDIGYLFKGGQPDGEIPFSQIKTVAFLEGENEVNYYRQIRVREKKAYFCIGYTDNMDLEEYAERSGAITDEYISELLNCLEKANLHKWKAKYEGNNGDTTGDWRWCLGIELIDGTVYSWGGGGMFGDNKPKEYESVRSVIVNAV